MTPIEQVKHWGWLLFLLGLLAVVAWDLLGEPGRPLGMRAMTEPITSLDVDQHRLNTVPPTSSGDWLVQQSFVAQHDGLSELELILARSQAPDPDENGRLTLTLLDDNGDIVAERTLLSRTLEHNDPVSLNFSRQFPSAGRSYLLQIVGNQANPVSLWGYDLDVYEGGEMLLLTRTGVEPPVTTVQDLRFTTRYQLHGLAAAESLADRLLQDGLILLLALVFLPLPALYLMQWRPLAWRGWDGMAWVGTALALGTAIWPLFWAGVTAVGGRLTSGALWFLLVGGWAGLLVLLVYRYRSANADSLRAWLPLRWRRRHALLLLLLLLGLALRLLAIRDLALPPWVDSSRHALITAVMIDSGQTIRDYGHFLPVDRFPYHYGFHTLSASLALLGRWEIPRLLLVLGQLLNALVPLTLYAAVWLMTRRWHAALLAAFLVALPFFFPAYYATWGRFTQLTAMLVLPLLVAFTWLLVLGARRWRQGWWVIALLAAAIFLLHLRVFVFFAPLPLIIWFLGRGRHGRWLALAALAAFLIVLPRLLTLSRITEPAAALSYNLPNYNEFPLTYYESGWDRYFIWLAGLLVMLLLIALWRRRVWAWLPLTMVLWTGLLLFLLAGDYLGLPSTSIVNLNSLYISLFLPLAIFLAVTLTHLWRWLQQAHWTKLVIGYVVAGVAVTAVLLFGGRQQVDILNAQTILAQSADLAGMEWLEQAVGAEATIAVNSWKWLGDTWTGSDGGAWIVPLTGLNSSTPPADYIYSRELAQRVSEFNVMATEVLDWSQPEPVAWLAEEGVTHIFVGARGGFFDPAELSRNRALTPLYAQDGVFVFELMPVN